MTSKELRIGNLILFRKEPIIVNWQELKWIQDGLTLDHEYIPLTEDWLLKFGYFKIDYKESHFVTKGHAIWICNNMFLCEKNGVILKYVHQLQNLFFALTNKELNYEWKTEIN